MKYLKLILLILWSFTFLGCTKQKPYASNGVIDLTNWNFEKDGPVKLDGEWYFYWNKLLYPQDFKAINMSENNFRLIRSVWNSSRDNQRKLPSYGYATYRLKIKINNTNKTYAIKMGEVFTAYKIWINGKEIFSAGLVGKNKNTSKPQYKPHTTHFKVNKKIIDVVLQISNYYYKDGGMNQAIVFGLEKDLVKEREESLIFNYFLFGSLIVMGFYHLGLAFLNKYKKTTFLFGLFCLIIASRILVTDESYIVNFIPNISWHIHIKLIVIGYYTGFIVFISFIYQLFKQDMSHKIIKLIQYIGLFSSLFVLVTPASIYTHTEIYYQIFILISSTYVLINIIMAVKKNRNGAKLILIGFLAIFIATFNDILYAQNMSRIQNLTSLGLFIFILLQSYILAKHFSDAVILNEELTIVNEHLANINLKLENSKNEIEKSYQKLLSAQDQIIKLEKKNSVLAMVVTANHEINQPLTIAKGNLQLLKMKLDKITRSDEIAEINKKIDLVLNNIDRIDKILTKYRNVKDFDFSDYSPGVTMVDFKEEDL